MTTFSLESALDARVVVVPREQLVANSSLNGIVVGQPLQNRTILGSSGLPSPYVHVEPRTDSDLEDIFDHKEPSQRFRVTGDAERLGMLTIEYKDHIVKGNVARGDYIIGKVLDRTADLVVGRKTRREVDYRVQALRQRSAVLYSMAIPHVPEFSAAYAQEKFAEYLKQSLANNEMELGKAPKSSGHKPVHSYERMMWAAAQRFEPSTGKDIWLRRYGENAHDVLQSSVPYLAEAIQLNDALLGVRETPEIAKRGEAMRYELGRTYALLGRTNDALSTVFREQ